MAGPTTFSPLAHRAFATILTAALFANLGNAVQAVGASWQLTASGEPADIVALVQTAINLPMLLLALPAGALADMFERRRIILAAQAAMLAVALLLAGLALAGEPPAWAILLLTALLACGIATFSPALGASIRETVPRAELAAAVALNILAFNTARTLGPAFGGAIVAWTEPAFVAARIGIIKGKVPGAV
jgi:MFS family permease